MVFSSSLLKCKNTIHLSEHPSNSGHLMNVDAIVTFSTIEFTRCFLNRHVQFNDVSLLDYIAVQPAKHATYVPHTAGRYSVKRFRKAQCPIVERLTNSLMMHGRNNGKKLMAVRIVKHAMEIIHLLTDQNPIQVIVDAVVNRYVLYDELQYFRRIYIPLYIFYFQCP